MQSSICMYIETYFFDVGLVNELAHRGALFPVNVSHACPPMVNFRLRIQEIR